MRSLMIFILTQYYSGDQIERNKMGWACSTLWGKEEVHTYKALVRKPEGKRTLGRTRRK
jgi:hypothetical protein